MVAEHAPASTVCEIHVGDDLEFLAGLPDAHLDWAYLDSSHQYEHTVAELELLDAKVAADGRILGHDWIEDPERHNHGASWRSASCARAAAGGSPRATTSPSGSSSGSAERTPAPQRKTRVTKPSRTAVTLRDVD